MGGKITENRAKVDTLLEEGYRLWDESSLPAQYQSERYFAVDAASAVYQGKYSSEFAAACQCFYLFRKLHSMIQEYPAMATLLGDYFFSQFSRNLIPLDSVPLINAFSSYLAAEIQALDDGEGYLDFIGSLSELMES